MKHNAVTEAVVKILDDVEEEISRGRILPDLDEQRKALRKAPRVAKSKNWDLV